jgi:uncharacterized protein YuzE
MDAIKRLVATESLKTTFLSQLIGKRTPPLFINYDEDADTFMLLLDSPNTETIVHYVNDDVALLYTPEQLEIVGLQIEDFQSEFVPTYNALQKVWRLSDSGIKRGNVWDLTLATQGRQLKVAIEVVKAAQPFIGSPAKQIGKVLEYT